jgi:hypothetical protein
MEGKGLQLFEERLAASKQGENVQFDIAVILAIISAVLPLIMNCFAPKPSMLRRRLGNRARVATAIRRETGMGFFAAMKEADNLFDLAEKATDEELQLLIDDCCGTRHQEPVPQPVPTPAE